MDLSLFLTFLHFFLTRVVCILVFSVLFSFLLFSVLLSLPPFFMSGFALRCVLYVQRGTFFLFRRETPPRWKAVGDCVEWHVGLFPEPGGSLS